MAIAFVAIRRGCRVGFAGYLLDIGGGCTHESQGVDDMGHVHATYPGVVHPGIMTNDKINRRNLRRMLEGAWKPRRLKERTSQCRLRPS